MTDKQPETLLPEDTAQALSRMIDITKAIINSYEDETNALALGNNLDFLEHTKTKMDMGDIYNNAAREFMDRQEEFKHYGGPMLQELVTLQQKLKAEAQINMNFLEKMEEDARKKANA